MDMKNKIVGVIIRPVDNDTAIITSEVVREEQKKISKIILEK